MAEEILLNLEGFHPLVTKVVARRVPAEHVEDLVQETIKRALRGISTLKSQEAMGSWLVRIASSVVSDFYRSRHVIREVQAGTETREVACFKFAQDCFQENYHSMMYRELVKLVISRLEPEERSLIESVYIKELGHSEAASQLGITETNLRVRMHRVRAKLRHLIAEYHDSVELFGRTCCEG